MLPDPRHHEPSRAALPKEDPANATCPANPARWYLPQKNFGFQITQRNARATPSLGSASTPQFTNCWSERKRVRGLGEVTNVISCPKLGNRSHATGGPHFPSVGKCGSQDASLKIVGSTSCALPSHSCQPREIVGHPTPRCSLFRPATTARIHR